jgi:hypothetical protein
MKKKFNPHVGTIIVSKVVREGSRTLIYSRDWQSRGNEYWFKVVGKAHIDVKVGDVVDYEPAGLTFGWFVEKNNV